MQVLDKMQQRLVGLQEEMKATAKQANGLLGFLGFGSSKPDQHNSTATATSGRSVQTLGLPESSRTETA